MTNDLYNKTLDLLRRNKPEPSSARQLTDRIMNNLDYVPFKKQKFIILTVNEIQWSVYKGLRALITAAAVFLIGFFFFQQWQINKKINRMEEAMISSYQFSAKTESSAESQQIQNILYTREKSPSEPVMDSLQTEELHISRKSLNYMLMEIQKLRDENISYREKLQQIYEDTIAKRSKK